MDRKTNSNVNSTVNSRGGLQNIRRRSDRTIDCVANAIQQNPELNRQSLAVSIGEIFSPLTAMTPSSSVRISKQQLRRRKCSNTEIIPSANGQSQPYPNLIKLTGRFMRQKGMSCEASRREIVSTIETLSAQKDTAATWSVYPSAKGNSQSRTTIW
jgi:hypothetical protein